MPLDMETPCQNKIGGIIMTDVINLHEFEEYKDALELPVKISLDKDLKQASKDMGFNSAKYLVRSYYRVQDYRIMLDGQLRAAKAHGEAAHLLEWVGGQMKGIEAEIHYALDLWTRQHEMGKWARNVCGVGPVLSAGLLANIDIKKATNPSKIWRFAGYDPSQICVKKEKALEWIGKRKVTEALVREAADHFGRAYHSLLRLATTTNKGESKKLTKDTLAAALARQPYNADLKKLCWKIGTSFKMQAFRPQCTYGHLYKERKAWEVAMNDRGEFAKLAAATLQAKNIKDPDTLATYKAGKLPDGRLDLRAMRWAVKHFMVHWWQEYYRLHYKAEPPVSPYAIAHMDHADLI
jgi:hypothetical protein